ncbi:amino acid ABC transporter substrate-binding protein [Roseibium sp. Sym1]|uniref:amino acid ABC transporter substrate-binding protein n=1 Tax=Roseibium sp. Sym1 TaxID=3016006 RepID=UPI0022B54A7C|nr:amino acid ABC transporter substrate-binding protein [Roseibium sp. Sym1]
MLKLTFGATALATVLLASTAFAADPIKIGRVVHMTGPGVGGDATSHTPNVELWVKQVNERGGLKVGDEMRLIEMVEYDDKTNPAETIKAVQRLATQDEVDFMLSPWGTGFNAAAAPIFAKYGFPQISVTNITDEIPELSERFPGMFFTLGSTTGFVEGLRDTLNTLRDSGAIGNKVAMVNVADSFGIELAAVARELLPAAGYEIVFDKSYPLGTADLSPVVKGAKAAEPDAFIAFSYPPDTFALTEQAIIEDLDVGAFYTAVATAFPAYAGKFGSKIEGNLGAGGVNLDQEAMKAYRAAFTELHDGPPEYWAAATYYAGLQVLEQAIEGAGTTDKQAVTDYIKANEFDTAIGTISFDEHNESKNYWTVGQWRDGAFNAVAGVGVPVGMEPVAKDGWN